MLHKATEGNLEKWLLVDVWGLSITLFKYYAVVSFGEKKYFPYF